MTLNFINLRILADPVFCAGTGASFGGWRLKATNASIHPDVGPINILSRARRLDSPEDG